MSLLVFLFRKILFRKYFRIGANDKTHICGDLKLMMMASVKAGNAEQGSRQKGIYYSTLYSDERDRIEKWVHAFNKALTEQK